MLTRRRRGRALRSRAYAGGTALFGALLCAACGGSSGTELDLQAITDAFESSHLALVLFDTGGSEIPDEPKIAARMTVIDDGAVNTLDSRAFDYDGPIGIELRGHSSQRFPKKQFGVETRGDQGDGIDVELLGFPEEEDWVFYAPYSDKTLIRNWFVYGLAAELFPYAPRTRFVEVFVDDLYWGLYLLTEKIKRDGNRVDIAKLDEDDDAEPEIAGGYLLELTNETTPGDTFVHTDRALLELKDPKASKVTEAQLAWITDHLNAFEDVLYGPDFEDPDSGWRAFADEDSFIDYALIQELVRNLDGFLRSTFISKDRGGLLRAGPVWDFNLAMGNVANHARDRPPRGFLFTDESVWIDRLLEDAAFADRYVARWHELRAGPFATDALMARIDSGVAAIGDAAARNFERWPVLGREVWPNPTPVPETYADEIAALKTWLATRVEWLDASIGSVGSS